MSTKTTIFFLFFINSCLSQVLSDSIFFDKDVHKRIYQFTIPETPFEVFLIESLDGKMKGIIKISLYRRSRKENQPFEKDVTLRSKITKRLFEEIDKTNLEDLNQPTFEEKCSILLDGEITFFHITTATISKSMHFNGINFHTSEENCENNMIAQNVLNILDQELNFKWRIEDLKNYLPEGKYSYIVGAVYKEFVVE